MKSLCVKAFPAERPYIENDEDHLALFAAAMDGAALCTVVGIDGSFSRRLGAQLAILPDGTIVGTLADGCLERQLASDCRRTDTAIVKRYGRGSDKIDFRLPCGGGLDVLIDPAPDRSACVAALQALSRRSEARLVLAPNPFLTARRYLPRLVVRAFGDGAELEALHAIGLASGIDCQVVAQNTLTLARHSGLMPADRWTAIVLLYHDHEWEVALLDEALDSEAFYIGAQGGHNARSARLDQMRRRGVGEGKLARIRSPMGTPPGSRTPQSLALAVLAEIAGEYERLRSVA